MGFEVAPAPPTAQAAWEQHREKERTTILPEDSQSFFAIMPGPFQQNPLLSQGKKHYGACPGSGEVLLKRTSRYRNSAQASQAGHVTSLFFSGAASNPRILQRIENISQVQFNTDKDKCCIVRLNKAGRQRPYKPPS